MKSRFPTRYHRSLCRTTQASAQHGIVMVIALVILVAVTLAGIAMYRSVSGGLEIAGNVAFKEGTTSLADSAVETARAWVTDPANVALRDSDHPDVGYYSTWDGTFDPATFDWNHGVAVVDGNLQYVIHRLCAIPGSTTASGQSCVTPPTAIQIGCGGGGAGDSIASCQYQPIFRITARATGPRNTISVVQVTMY